MTLRVHTDIPFGNACEISVVENAVSTVSFTPDPHGGPACLWFCLRIECEEPNPCENGRLRLVIKHADTALGLAVSPTGVRPVVRFTAGDWVRLGEPERRDLPDGRFTFVWEIDRPSDYVDVALCYPYGADDVDVLAEECAPAFRLDSIGVSQGARSIQRLSNDYGGVDNERPGVYLTARQHSGETPGSWVMDGFLRRIREQGDVAPLVWAVPLTNIDGVVEGDYGKDNFPYDLNRAWGKPPMRHETLVMMADIRRWTKRCSPAFAIDFHGPGGSESEGAYTFVPAPESDAPMKDETTSWAHTLVEAMGPYAKRETPIRVARYASRWNTPGMTEYFRSEHGVPSLTIETPYGLCGDTVMTREEYRALGARIADGVTARLND
jgi:hypothetical protein